MQTEQGDGWIIYHLDTEETPVEGVIKVIAAISNTEPTDIDPIYPVVDPDALDALFRKEPNDTKVEFRYHGCQVEVTGDGVVKVRADPDES